MTDHSRKGHKWITEEFYKLHDVYGFRAAMFVEWGFRPADVKRTTERIKVCAMPSTGASQRAIRVA